MKSSKLWLKVEGDEKAPLLIFLHGFMGTHKDFCPLIQKLRSAYLCVSIDLPGHGNSKSARPSSAQEFDQFILEGLSDYSRRDKTLVGYSMGGRIALRLLKCIQPQSLILISSRIQNLSQQEKNVRALEDQKRAEHLKEDYTSFLASWYDQKLFKTLKKRPELLQDMLKKRALENPSLLAEILNLTSPAQYLLPDHFLSDFKKPLLYLCGMEDPFYFKQKDLIKNSNAWIFSQSGSSHALHLEEPQSTSQIINQFHRYNHDRMDGKKTI